MNVQSQEENGEKLEENIWKNWSFFEINPRLYSCCITCLWSPNKYYDYANSQMYLNELNVCFIFCVCVFVRQLRVRLMSAFTRNFSIFSK